MGEKNQQTIRKWSRQRKENCVLDFFLRWMPFNKRKDETEKAEKWAEHRQLIYSTLLVLLLPSSPNFVRGKKMREREKTLLLVSPTSSSPLYTFPLTPKLAIVRLIHRHFFYRGLYGLMEFSDEQYPWFNIAPPFHDERERKKVPLVADCHCSVKSTARDKFGSNERDMERCFVSLFFGNKIAACRIIARCTFSLHFLPRETQDLF